MQFTNLVLSVAACAQLASAHFRLTYPYWRADSLALSSTNTSITQWNYPCAGIGQETSNTNRTLWPLTGGSISFAGSHPWAYTYVNLGIGETVNSFNISLVDGFNQTGNGTFCWNKVAFDPARFNVTVADGTKASIQVIQIAHSGASLYNCADITFSSNATTLSGDQCRNSTGVSGVALQNVAANATRNGTNSTSGSGSGSGTSGAGSASFAVSALVGGVALALAGNML